MLLQRDQSWLDDGGNAIGPARIVEFEISRQEPIPFLCVSSLTKDSLVYIRMRTIYLTSHGEIIFMPLTKFPSS